MNILLYEKSEHLQNALKKYIRRAVGKTNIKMVSDLKDIFDSISDNKFNLAIIDADHIYGKYFQLVDSIRTNNKNIRIILLTSFPMDKAKEKYLEFGSDYYFDKTYEIEKFVDTIAELTEKHDFDKIETIL